MNDDKRLNYWNGLYDKKNFFGTGPTKLAKHAESLLNDKKINNLLEIGCGQGRDAIHFSQLGYDVNAFDISRNAIKFVEEMKNSLELKNLDLMVHDAEKSLLYPKNNFDLLCIKLTRFSSISKSLLFVFPINITPDLVSELLCILNHASKT